MTPAEPAPGAPPGEPATGMAPGEPAPGMAPGEPGAPALDGSSPESGVGASQEKEPPKPLTFADKAAVAFGQGREKDGLQYLFAHALTSDDAAAKEVLDKMGWITPLKKPSMTVRWGIAIEYEFKGPRGYTGSLYPIGTTQNLATKGGAPAAGGQPQPGIGAEGGAGQGNASLQQHTGELGQKVLQQLQQRIAKGDFGKVLVASGNIAAPGAAAGMPGAGMHPGGEMNVGAEPGGAPPGGFEGAAAPGQAAGRASDVGTISTGIVFLGVVRSKDLLEKAQAAKVDALCVFNVVVTPNPRLGHILNETTIRLHDTLQAKELWESRKLNNIKVQLERADPKEDQDPVDREMEALFKKIDAEWVLGPLPQGLQTEHVLNRLRGLIGQTHDNPLPVLGEVRMYQTRGLLPDAHLLTAYQKLIGESAGSQLAKGTEEEKKQAIEQWLPSGL